MAENQYIEYFDLEEIIEKIKKYLPSLNVERFKKAFFFAEEAHKGQIRKDGKTPYIVHPLEAVKILIELHADEDTLISAILHDVPEDTPRTIKDVKDNFGDKVAYLVDGITKLSKVQYQHNMPERDIESLKKLLLHSSKDLRVLIIKLADRLHNMQTLDNVKKSEKRLRIATETLEIYVPIANLLGIREIKNQLQDLCFKYMFPTEYLKLDSRIERAVEKRKKNYNQFAKALSEISLEENIPLKTEEREKNLYNIYKYLSSIGKTVDYVDDRIGVKIIVDNVSDCYKLLGAIHLKFPPLMRKFKDYIANPKSNGYRSLHTTVFGVEGMLTEIQIRTKDMDIDAEYGIMAPFFRENQKGKSEEIFSADINKSSWLKKILEINDVSDSSLKFIENLKLDIFQERIVVLTPKGQPVDLPQGATVLDFAYAIDPRLGNHALKADVNGKDKPISAELHTRDVVNVITSKNIKPDLTWLSFVKTSNAKRNILKYLDTISDDVKIRDGKQILQKELDILNLGLVENIKFRKLKRKLKENYQKEFHSLNDIYKEIGQGSMAAKQVSQLMLKKPVFYKEEGEKLHIKILAKNRFGLTRDIYDVLYKRVDNIYYFKGWASKYAENAAFVCEVQIRDLDRLKILFNELEQLEDVYEVHKITSKRVLALTSFAFIIGLGWLFHPFLLKLISNSRLNESYPLTTSLLIYVGLFVLFTAVIYFMGLITKFFPVFRDKKRVWLFSFVFPLLVVGFLMVEVIFYDLKLSWTVVILEFLIIYIYLGLSYKNFKKSRRKT